MSSPNSTETFASAGVVTVYCTTCALLVAAYVPGATLFAEAFPDFVVSFVLVAVMVTATPVPCGAV